MYDNYGVTMTFCRSFIRPEVEGVFGEISKEFLENETLIQEKKVQFKDIFLPYEDGITVYSQYTQTILGMMLTCVEKGSSYSASILLEIYKAYYKDEYRRLKKYHKLTADSFIKEFADPENLEETNNKSARLTVMSRIMNIDVDESWASLLCFMNNHEKSKREFWKRVEAAAQSDEIIEARLKERSVISKWIINNHPEMCSKVKYESDRRYNIIRDIELLIQLAVQGQDTMADGLLKDIDDLYVNVLDVVETLNIKNKELPDFSQFTLRELVLLAYINHMATEYGRLYRIRREELWDLLGVSRYELVKDEEITDDKITLDMFRKMSAQKNLDGDRSIIDTKLLNRIRSLLSKT